MVEQLRRLRMTSTQIAAHLRMALSTVTAVLKRIGLHRRSRIRGIGWEYVHVCVDNATRLAYVEVLDDETAATAAAVLRRAVADFAELGVRACARC